MRVLGLDTALDDVSVGLLLPDGRVLERSFRHERDALRRLAGLVRDVLGEAGLSASDIDVVACTRGPGSFTGIRVGVAAARALADACGARMAGVSTLRALCMAGGGGGSCARLALAPCRPGEVYAGLYRPDADGVWQPVRPDAALSVEALEQWVCGAGVEEPVEVVGPAAAAAGHLPAGMARVREDAARVRIADVLTAALQDAAAGCLVDPMELVPEYLRPSQAEIRAAQGGA